jgi:hypothetical protein
LINADVFIADAGSRKRFINMQRGDIGRLAEKRIPRVHLMEATATDHSYSCGAVSAAHLCPHEARWPSLASCQAYISISVDSALGTPDFRHGADFH